MVSSNRKLEHESSRGSNHLVYLHYYIGTRKFQTFQCEHGQPTMSSCVVKTNLIYQYEIYTTVATVFIILSNVKTNHIIYMWPIIDESVKNTNKLLTGRMRFAIGIHTDLHQLWDQRFRKNSKFSEINNKYIIILFAER